ncbi:magnesium transporter [Nocardiopsis sp. Huas11]|uniref:magnesium and cobalt transport protein CorA n=1 Tax=Nocardiopsis sp. Huas11 TaxID=2183912 RepID=UPI000EAE6661|nr:magnesium and cobalt transport protein CorA [Nocardiopsis sp. Huas11]RKS08325.1 magnesium transporter [Nocardiopsis sp. Huas11]
MTDAAPERVMALGGEAVAAPAGPGAVRSVLHRRGRLERETDTSAEARRALDEDDGLMAWVALTEPDAAQVARVAHEFGLPEPAVEDSVVAHQRPKAERYRDGLFVVLRPARYDTAREVVRVGEVHVFTGHRFVITIAHGDHGETDAVRERLEEAPRLAAIGPLGVLYAVLDRVVDDYAPAVSGLQDDIDEVEDQVLATDRDASRRTYRLSRQVIALQRAVDPLGDVLSDLLAGLERPETLGPGQPQPYGERPDREAVHAYVRDVADHVAAVRERVDGFRQMLQNILTVNSALIQQAQNEAMKKVSSWGGILVVPTLISSVYGMNIAPQRGFHWAFSWPLTLTAMTLVSITLYVVFRRRNWL